MHPEVKRALDTNLSVLEVIRLFTKHHSGVPEDRIELRLNWELELRHSDFSFWDTWKPLFRKLFWYSDPEPASASEPFLSIHKNLTREIISWLCDSKRRSNIHLIAEGQTQTENASENHRGNAFATICYDAHRFGLPLRDAPRLPPGIFSLCAALATHSPPYRRILTRILIEDPKVFKLSTRTRFKKLIYKPWKTLEISHPQYVAAPPVIVLRWHDPKFWDEELLSSIYEFASPLLWIISFSPEFKLPIQDLLDPFKCPRLTRLPVCYNDAPADTKLFLHHRFTILRQKHEEMFAEHEVWPSEEQMFHLTRMFMGSFDAIDVVIYFVDWEGEGGPNAHLEKFLAYMVDSPSPSDERPYCVLDHFYHQAYSAIPHDLDSIWDKDSSPNIVRVEPAGDLDKLFIDKCEGLAEPLELEEKQVYWELRPTGPQYALLGLGAGTVLVVLATLRAPGVAPSYCGFSVYTSAMLELM
ncbi:hypothetical protein AGABI2DRAFT_117493 [Agaricus bisporus var. bisporus H97]|uniref:hypothetical protein n=1 Tax=Agaricus bisporus var. bisporus (strain H97 / ATCC MYA-4626 / FGSC 10389) TaxID=936046 RepID=UPI00029F7749|nr:hypothetical protein AGABI2DRAFT_117493 [Agaricus bisporus var. bisporus H97]EKV48690.1 hypothetical protein AGABI2DRAFT_117493 [Agaricus bisporus var. bisporus H97]